MGDQVWIPDQETQGTVQREQSNRSYTVHTSTGIIRRNRRDLNILPSSELVEEEPSLNPSETIPVQEDQSTDTSEPQSELRRSNRHIRPPDRYGVWFK